MAETLIRTAVLYVVVVTVLRILGKRQIGELQPNELVVTIMISELAAIPMQDLNRPLSSGIIAIFMLAFLEIILSTITLKFKKARRIVNGKPAILIHDGVIDQKMLKKMRLTVDDIMEDLRIAGIFRVEDVEHAIIETNGKMSVLQKAETLPVPASQTQTTVPKNTLPAVVISDGKPIQENIPVCGQTEEKLKNALTSRRLTAKDVFIMTADENDQYMIIKRER